MFSNEEKLQLTVNHEMKIAERHDNAPNPSCRILAGFASF